MANIRTLAHLNSDEEEQYSTSTSGSYELADSSTRQSRRYLRTSNIDGTESDVPLDDFNERPVPFLCTLCCVSCFPCFVGPVCSDAKKKSYISFCTSCCFALSLVQIVMLIVELSVGGVVSLSTNASIGPGVDTLITLGAKDTDLIKHDFEIWRWVTPIFLHAGIIHLLLNLFFQLRFGIHMEKKWGVRKFLSIYMISGIGGNIASCVLLRNEISVGASGALLGVMGAFIAQLGCTWTQLEPVMRRISMLQTIIIVLVLMMMSFIPGPGIDWAAHLGGLIVGVLMGGLYFSSAIEVARVPSILLRTSFGFVLGLYFFVFITLIYAL